MLDNNSLDSDHIDIKSKATKIVAIFFLSIALIFTMWLVIFYSSLRARCQGISIGYLRAIELMYQSGSFSIDNTLTNHNFDTGIYRVKVTYTKSSVTTGALIVKIEVQDKMFGITHHIEELKLIPISRQGQ